MAGANRPARLNRSLLAAIGLILLAAGVAVAAASLGRLPAVAPTSPLLTAPAATPGWLPWAGAGAAVMVGLLCLRWLMAQAQCRPKTGTWTLPAPTAPAAATEDGPRGATRVRASTAAAPFLDDVESYPGVHAAKAWLTGEHRRPALYLEVTATADTELAALRPHRHSRHPPPGRRARPRRAAHPPAAARARRRPLGAGALMHLFPLSRVTLGDRPDGPSQTSSDEPTPRQRGDRHVDVLLPTAKNVLVLRSRCSRAELAARNNR